MSARRAGALAAALALVVAVAAPGCRRGAPPAAAPGTLAVTAALEPDAIRVGDRARLSVVVDHPAGGSLRLPELERGKAVVVISRSQTTSRLAGSGAAAQERTVFAFELTSFEVGERRVGEGSVAFEGGGVALREPFPVLALKTESSLAGPDAPLRPAKPLARWPPPVLPWVLAGAGLAVALAAGAGVTAARRRRARRVAARAAEAPAPKPHETALRALAALEQGGLARQRDLEPFFRQLSAIVRSYLEQRFGLRAPERTTEELLREAAAGGQLAERHQALARAFLEQCDLVKFARHEPAPDAPAQALAAARRLVAETAREAAP